mgnify:FL=1
MPKALITGITGQDGSYLAELLLEKGYEVHGLVRRAAVESYEHRFSRINHIKDKIKLHSGDIVNYERIFEIIAKIQPDELYHLAAQSFVQESFEDPSTTIMMNIQGTLNVLNAIKNVSPKTKFYFAGSSEMFGKVRQTPQNEETPFHPRSPYGISKVTGFELTRNFREAYGLFACSGILFNHESPRRGHEFVTRKITNTISKIAKGKEHVLVLGNLDAKRDWGFAGDYVRAMWLMLQQDKPDDYVIATGKSYSVKNFVEDAFNKAEIKNFETIDFSAMSQEEADNKINLLREQKNKVFVVQHPRFYRKAEVENLQGDASKAHKFLNWQPETSFEELVKKMIEHDLNLAS